MPGQASFHRTRTLKLLDAAETCISIAEEQAAHTPTGQSRPLLPADFRRRVTSLAVDLDKRLTTIREVEVQ